MTEEQIKHMVDRFLVWRLPENFNPDGGICFQKTTNENTPWPHKSEPVGTNLFDGQQAKEMVRYMIEGLPVDCPWRCFHCGEVFTDKHAAADHFGLDLGTLPACIEVLTETQKAIVEGRREWKRRAQGAEDENEKLGQQIGCDAWDLASRFKGARTIADAFNLYDSMEGRALAAEERVAELERSFLRFFANGGAWVTGDTEKQAQAFAERGLLQFDQGNGHCGESATRWLYSLTPSGRAAINEGVPAP
jgi:hypothetical protein